MKSKEVMDIGKESLGGSFVESAFSKEQVGDGEIESAVGCVFLGPVAQAEFLRDAMARLGMTRNEFAERIAIKRRTLDTWLLPSGSNTDRGMPKMAWKYIQEILQNEQK